MFGVLGKPAVHQCWAVADMSERQACIGATVVTQAFVSSFCRSWKHVSCPGLSSSADSLQRDWYVTTELIGCSTVASCNWVDIPKYLSVGGVCCQVHVRWGELQCCAFAQNNFVMALAYAHTLRTKVERWFVLVMMQEKRLTSAMQFPNMLSLGGAFLVCSYTLVLGLAKIVSWSLPQHLA